jgi:hypothetical protein
VTPTRTPFFEAGDRMTNTTEKTLGQVIDEVLTALKALNEDDQVIAIQAACRHLEISPERTPESNRTSIGGTNPSDTNSEQFSDSSAASRMDIRSLKEEKQPKTATEMACVVGYYLDALAHPSFRKAEIGSADIEKYFKQAGYRLPKRKEQVLVDAKAAGYFDSAGHGKYRLNPVGHNLVVHTLPRSKK